MPTPPTFPVEPALAGTSAILIFGKRYELPSPQIDVRTYDQPGAYSFYGVDSPDGLPLFGPRWLKPGVRADSFDLVVDCIQSVIIHDEETTDSGGAFRARVGRSLSIHFLIDRDGVLWQPLDVADCAFHAGNANWSSIGVSLVHRDPKAPYTEPQYDTLIELLKTLLRRLPKLRNSYPIDRQGRLFPRPLWPSGDWHGYLGHKQVEPSANDPGPTFDWERIFNALRSSHESLPLDLEQGTNFHNLLVPDHAKRYADRYQTNNEDTTGWYPMGINGTWHGGVHLAAAAGTSVRAMSDGVLVAACIDPRPTEVGQRAFVLLRHELAIAPDRKGAAPEKLVFFTLYMHLAQVPSAPDDQPRWLIELRGRNSPAIAVLEQNQIATIAWRDDPVGVLAGEIVGSIGVLGTPPVATLHVEVFAERAIELLPKLPGSDYFEPFIASDNHLKVSDRAILDLFGKDRSPEGITRFWADRTRDLEAKGRLRKLVVRHLSEWSDQVDWLQTLARIDDWERDPAKFDAIVKSSGIGRDAVRAVLPFIWLTRQMATHIGLDVANWHGTLDHFHPIHFLMWLQNRATREFVHLQP